MPVRPALVKAPRKCGAGLVVGKGGDFAWTDTHRISLAS